MYRINYTNFLHDIDRTIHVSKILQECIGYLWVENIILEIYAFYVYTHMSRIIIICIVKVMCWIRDVIAHS